MNIKWKALRIKMAKKKKIQHRLKCGSRVFAVNIKGRDAQERTNNQEDQWTKERQEGRQKEEQSFEKDSDYSKTSA